MRSEQPVETTVADELAIIYMPTMDKPSRLYSLQNVLIYYGMEINVAKTEHMSTMEYSVQMKLSVEELKNVDNFK